MPILPNPGIVLEQLKALFNQAKAYNPFPKVIDQPSPGLSLPRTTSTSRSRSRTARRPEMKYKVKGTKNIGTLSGRQSASAPQDDLLMQLLESLQEPVGVDTGALRGQIDPIYDARVNLLKDRISRAEGRTGENRQDVEAGYEALARDYERLGPEAAAQAEEARAQIEQLYGTLASDIEGNYARIAQEQGDLFKQLGIEAAAPDVLGPQGELAAQGASRANELGAINEQRYMDIGNIDESYYRQGAPLARLQGTNRSTDLLDQLNDFISGTEGEISMAEAERSAAYNQLLAQAQSQSRQQESDNLRILMQMFESQQTNQPEIPMSQAYLSALPPELQQTVGGTVRSLERSPEVVLNRVRDPRSANPDTYTSVTDAWWLDQIDKMYESGQLSEQARQALLNYLRMYLSES
jgi:uncharacterized membrane protein